MIAVAATLFCCVFATGIRVGDSIGDRGRIRGDGDGIPRNERKRYVQLPLDDGASGIEILIGDKRMIAALSTLVSELILVDINCAIRDLNCPRYCSTDYSSDFAFLCEPTCKAGVVANFPTTCGDRVSNRYDSRQRPLSRQLAERIKLYPAGHRQIYGNLWEDEIVSVRSWSRFAKTEWSLRRNVTFLSARLSDKRLFYMGNAVFGLRPGKNCAATALTAAFGVQPLISMSHIRTPDETHGFYGRASGLLTVGALDGVWCHGWKWAPSRTPGDVVVFAESVDFMGVQFRNVEIIIDFLVGVLVLPNRTAEYLLQQKILHTYQQDPSVQYFAYDCERNPPIRFFANASEPEPFLELTNKSIRVFKQPSVPAGLCGASIVTDLTDPFSSERYGDVWILGFHFLWAKCLAIDYRRGEIGFAAQRMEAAKPMIPKELYNHNHQVEMPKPK